MTSQQRVCVCLVCYCECVYVSVICYTVDEKKPSVPASHHSARRLLYLLPESPCATDKCACTRTHAQTVWRECLCVSYCWRQCRHSWEGRVLCIQQQSWPFALDFLSSSVLQMKEKKREKEETDIFRRRSRLWFLWQSHTSPHSSSSKAQKQKSNWYACWLIHFLIH